MPLSGEDYVEHTQSGMLPKQVKQMKQGLIRPQSKLDLHNMTVDQAETAFLNFLNRSKKNKLRALLIVHGKGLQSSSPYPILKNEVVRWLKGHGNVLAFCSAQPKDGGRGAVYVLLKRG